MKKIQLEKQVAEPIDDETMAALEVAMEEFRRGEGMTLEEAQNYLKRQIRDRDFIIDYEAGAEPIDDVTVAAIEAAEEQVRRGQTIPLEQVKINVRKRYQEWLKAQKEEAVPAK